MLPSQKIALAAQVHVVLRRKTGRVTDTEWMAQNADYAREVLRFTRLKAREGNDAELGELADRLERGLLAPEQPPRRAVAVAEPVEPAAAPDVPRYVGGIR
ncbi:hypothetical protein HHL11_13015 [Ramlibacter sp. G-1-2-2]|uniref:Uncharacterized protein n=1 Tax=Ramlibacter agri TaxID=2728837 RepID=A0A848HAP1_9BURK|nr:hypothetical protein [Ramlibacter agri]NML44678.1 hypothetical protein [Ramlibacter agri]